MFLMHIHRVAQIDTTFRRFSDFTLENPLTPDVAPIATLSHVLLGIVIFCIPLGKRMIEVNIQFDVSLYVPLTNSKKLTSSIRCI
jgi:hypothetical protein